MYQGFSPHSSEGAGTIKRIIYVRPIGPVEGRIIEFLQRNLQRYLGFPVEPMENMAIPENSFERKRNQYNSTKILKEILRDIPPFAYRILGVVDRDLCIPILTYVFGEAQLEGTAAVISLARLRQEYYGLHPNRDVFYDRVKKEALHELGHTFGLTHCSSRQCVMSLAYTVVDVDRRGSHYCDSCESSLKLNRERR